MKNAYVTMTEAMLSLRSCSGRLIQIECKLEGASNPAVAKVAMPEVRDVRFAVNAAMDQLVEVQAALPVPTDAQVRAHYSPDIPVGKPLKAHLGKPEPAFTDAILSMEEGDGRPAGWTEALALEFIGTQYVDCADQFAKAFNEGDWPTIQKEWPEFQTWLNGHD